VRRAGALAVLLAVPAAAPAVEWERLTLDLLFEGHAFDSAAFTLRWSPDSRSIVYRHDEFSGASAWWREDVATGAKSRLADWSALSAELRKQRPSRVEPPAGDVNAAGAARFDPAWSADATRVAGAEAGDLYVLELATGRARFVTDDPTPDLFPAWSPDGRRLAFVKAGDLYWIEVDGGRVQRLTDRGGVATLWNGMADWAYEEELEVARSFWWSPDGRRLAFVQYDTSPVSVYPILDDLEPIPRVEEQRYPQAGGTNARVKLGVVEAEGGAPRWLDLGSETDFYLPRAGFTPDGAHVWYVWLSRDQKRLELRLAEPATGASRTVLSEQDAAWINLGSDPLFVDAQRFVWTSERDGWRHLYLYGLDGRLVRRLTSGAWQVEKVYGLDREARRVFFQATEKDARERHVYAVGLDGGGFTRLSREDGTHDVSLAPDARHYVDTFSNLRTPPRIDLCTAAGARVRTLSDGVLPGVARYGPAAVELGSVAADDGTPLGLAMIKPPEFDPGRKYPALLYVYGGPHDQSVNDRWGGTVHLFLRCLAEQGMVVFWVENRGGAGRGHAFETPIARRLGEQELRDQLAGVRHLKAQPWIDGSRLGVYGGSYGGFMALTALLRAPEAFTAGVAYAPVTDWRLYDSIYTERYMGTPEGNPEGYTQSAPLTHAGALRGRLLLLHGTMDNNVHVQHTLMLADELRKAGRSFEMMLYPRVRHGLRRSHVKLDFHRRVASFLVEALLGREQRDAEEKEWPDEKEKPS
jgi:dipeptidyl-peptidase-4